MQRSEVDVLPDLAYARVDEWAEQVVQQFGRGGEVTSSCRRSIRACRRASNSVATHQ
jgi:hypothetical protein